MNGYKSPASLLNAVAMGFDKQGTGIVFGEQTQSALPIGMTEHAANQAIEASAHAEDAARMARLNQRIAAHQAVVTGHNANEFEP